jgi:hypothetical protein
MYMRILSNILVVVYEIAISDGIFDAGYMNLVKQSNSTNEMIQI